MNGGSGHRVEYMPMVMYLDDEKE